MIETALLLQDLFQGYPWRSKGSLAEICVLVLNLIGRRRCFAYPYLEYPSSLSQHGT